MIDLDADAKLNHLHCRMVVNTMDRMRNEASYIRSVIHKRLVDSFSAVALDAVKKTEGKYADEYSIDVYVLTSEQLEKYVQRRAERLAVGYPHHTFR